MQNVLIVEDDATTRDFLVDFFSLQKIPVEAVSNGKEAIERLRKNAFDLVFTDMKMPKASGKEVIAYCNQHVSCLVIAMSAFASIENAVEAMQLGAFHYLIKPFSLQTLEAITEKAKDHIQLIRENQWLKETHFPEKTHLHSKNPFMKQLFSNVRKFAKTSASIFITGESGTGKEVIASMIHAQSLRKKQGFIKVNCAAIAESLLESEFFGHEKGAFTGAEKRRLGRFELAHQGTLLLDEVTEMPLHLQSKLLRVLQEQEFERLGSETSIKVDVRIIATTNRDIQQAIKEHLFREDLFYRLHVIPIFIPPLRERKEDIPVLAEHFLESFCQKMGRKKKKLSKHALHALLDYSFPGNVRELSNILERALALSLEEEIQEEEIHIQASSAPVLPLKHWEKTHILDTMRALGNNPKIVAEKLGITLKTLRTKLKEYGRL